MVRFFAMRDLTGYQKPMKDFLSKFMRKNKEAPEEALVGKRANTSERPMHPIDKIRSEEKPFHVRTGLEMPPYMTR